MSESIFKQLSKPFPAEDIEWRIGRAGKKKDGRIWALALAYIDARAVMDRLDAVFGPDNWQDSYRKEGDAYICKLSLRIGDEWISKEDAADSTDIEAVKGGVSGALKRAAVKWGLGRYLYNLTESFVEIADKGGNGARYGKLSQQDGGTPFYWHPPKLAAWALPSEVDQNEVVKEKTLEKKEELKKEMGRTATPKIIKHEDIDYILLNVEQAKSLSELQEYWLSKDNSDRLHKLSEAARVAAGAAKDAKKIELQKAELSSVKV